MTKMTNMQLISHVHNSNLIFNREIPIDISQQS